MDLQDYVDKLHRAEQAHDLNAYTLEGFRLWPLFRSQTIGMFRNPQDYFSPASSRKTSRPPSFKERLLNRYYSGKFLSGFRKQLKAAPIKSKVDVLLYSKYAAHTDKVDGKWYDRFVDPFFEKLAPRYNVLKLEIGSPEKNEKRSRVVETCYVDESRFKDHFFYRSKFRGVPHLSQQKSFGEISSLTGIPFEPSKTDSAFREVIYYRELFREIFKRVRPRFVFFKCYYEHDSFGLVLAAKEAGIRTVDIQHGKQGISHPMYTHFTQIPEGGYELLPDIFWNWGEESKENIFRWMNRKNIHVPVVGGNLWLAKWKQEDLYRPVSAEEESFIRSLKEYDRVIFFALQPLDKPEMLPPHIIEAVRNSPKGWLWLMRAHPFQKITKEELAAMIGAESSNWEMQYATSLPLYHLLKLVGHHVTLWSSTCFEANDFDVPTTIAHAFGKKLYQEQLDKGIFTYADNSADLIRIIGEKKPNQRTNYIETDPLITAGALKSIGLPLS